MHLTTRMTGRLHAFVAHFSTRMAALYLASALITVARASAQTGAEAPFVATNIEVVHRMLELARVTPDDVVYDLGSGDGRIVIAAAKRYGARGVGVEIDAGLVRDAWQNADSAGVGQLVEFRQEDLFEAPIGDATVVTLFLGPDLNERLRPKLLAELRPGTRIVSHFFEIGDWRPDSSVVVQWGMALSDSPLHLWVIPANVEGSWKLTAGSGTSAATYRLRLRQRYQRVKGAAHAGRRNVMLTDVKLMGDRIAFTLHDGRGRQPSLRFTGRVEDGTMRGTMTNGNPGQGRTWIATR